VSTFPGRFQIQADAEQVANAAAELFVATAAKAIQERCIFRVALSGGSTPKRAYELLATKTFSQRIDWDHVHLFWGDERYVPSDHPDSNFRMTAQALLQRVSIPGGHVHRVKTELAPPAECAADYERTIRESFGSSPPEFDLIYLGLGTNGHTASLFPHSAGLREKKLVFADNIEEVKAWRISMSAPLINQGRVVAFLMAGVEKAQVLQDVTLGPRDPERLPAQLIAPQGELVWIVDKGAASLVASSSASSSAG